MNNKRPKWVWVIFLFILFIDITFLYNTYALSTGALQLPDEVVIPQDTLHYIKNFVSLFVLTLAAVLLFIRKEVAKWLFLGMLIYSILMGIYTSIFPTFPAKYHTALIIGRITNVLIYSLITWYSFQLKEQNYYDEKNNS